MLGCVGELPRLGQRQAHLILRLRVGAMCAQDGIEQRHRRHRVAIAPHELGVSVTQPRVVGSQVEASLILRRDQRCLALTEQASVPDHGRDVRGRIGRAQAGSAAARLPRDRRACRWPTRAAAVASTSAPSQATSFRHRSSACSCCPLSSRVSAPCSARTRSAASTIRPPDDQKGEGPAMRLRRGYHAAHA